jgi:putative methyltransferase (TIGR04325 family)
MKKKSKIRYIFEGIFNNFNECYKKNKNCFYKDKDYEKKQKEIIKSITKNLVSKKPIIPFYKQHTQHLINSLSLIKKSKVNILDVGGGWGIGYANCVEAFDKKKLSNINYNIFDLTNICNLGKKYFKKKIKISNKNLNYYSDLNELKKMKFDIIFFGSSLQYFKDPFETLKYFSNFNCSYIIFIDTYLVKSKSFFTLQKYYESSVPHSFLNENNFLKIFRKRFDLVLKSYSHTSRLDKIGTISMNNFPTKYRLDNSFNLIFINNNYG